MKKRIRRFICFALTILVTSVLCLTLYRFNNKNTKKSPQASQGLLVLSEDDLNTPVYLIDGWAYYPEQLLEPDALSDTALYQYMFYTDIGDFTQLSDIENKESAHGSGTYVLHIAVPKAHTVYALEIPEIFSSYRLYINGIQKVQMGDPDPQNYRSCTQNRTISFEASGHITLLFAVSDFSHYYSGIVYPPAIGTPHSLARIQNVRFGLSVMLITTALLTAISALYLGIRMKDKNALIFFLLCLSMCGFSSYQPVHTLFALPVFPIYAIELFSGYLFSFFTVLLHSSICAIDRRIKYPAYAVSGSFCILALLYGLFASRLTAPLIQIFSSLVFLFKILLCTYLLVTSWLYFDRKASSGSFLFYASISYAAFFVWDRILPDYEPVFGGWYAEWGCFILVAAIGCSLWRDMVSAYLYGLIFAEEHHQMVRQLSMQNAYMEKLTGQISKNRKTVHDFRQHLHTIARLVQQLSYEKDREYVYHRLSTYLDTLTAQQTARSDAYRPLCKNIAVDALLQYYYAAAEKDGIRTKFRLCLPDRLAFSDVELCTMLGNLLENALHACQQEHGCDRFITLTSRESGSSLFICIENSYNGIFQKRGKHFLSLSSCEARFGIGLESVQEIASLHGGTVNIYPLEHIFRVGLILPLQKQSVRTSEASAPQFSD